MAYSKEDIKYAYDYSSKVWNELMRRHRERPGYWIGANDVSDIVMNAILCALDEKSMPDDFRNI